MAAFEVTTEVSWTVTLFYWSADYLWTRTQLLGFGGLTIGSSLAVAFGILGLWRWNKFPVKGAIFLTPLYFIKCRFDDIWYWGLWQISDVQPINHYRNGSYTHTTVTFIFDEGKESVSLNNQNSLNHLFDCLKTWNAQTHEAFMSGDWEYFAQHDDFFDTHGQLADNRTSPAISGKAWSIGLLIALTCGLAITAIANYSNGYFDDKKSWDDAAVNNKVSAYRKYIENHPSGRWALDANKRIQQQYEASSLNYQASRSLGFDENASAAIVGILNYAKQTQQYRVRVAFERHNEIPKNIEDQLRRQFEVTNVLSIGDSFSDQRMQWREQQILSSVTSAFKSVIPEDILEFADSGGAEQSVAFIINYKVKSGKSLYFRDTDSQIDPYSRPYYPGIYLSWDFEIRVPSQQGYRFTLESKPASQIQYAYSYGSETATVYDRMAESAFDDFRHELVKRLGLNAASAGTASQPTPSPTPDLTGIYTSQLGQVEIKPHVNGFSFALNVGTSRCEGAISGKAKWSKGSNAVYRVPLEKEVYEDPSSFYYQKTCQLIFRFSENQVKVTQSDGCTYYHGAECDFNGIYHR
jgi:hypothetical protein